MRYLTILTLLLLAGACLPKERGAPAVPAELDTLLAELRQAHAPDKRVALLDIEALQQDGQWVVAGQTNLPEAKAELSSRLAELGWAETVELLPAAELEGQHYGIVKLSACNIRSAPKHSAELSTQATLGTPLRIYKREGGWHLVQTPDGYLGWLDPGGFALMDEAAYQTWMDSPKCVYLPELGFAYAAPQPDAPPVGDLLAGNILRLLRQADGYAEVQYPDGRSAFVPQAEFMPYGQWLDSRAPTADNILAAAHRFMGRPYLWGGTSGKGVDCSGFTKTVFYLNGLLLPRDASQQVHVGQALAKDTTLANLLPGDLLFFGQAAAEGQKERVTHVAIYKGEGQIIHASGEVCVESLRRGDPDFNEYRLETFLRAKRMIGPAASEQGVLPLAESAYY